MQLNLTLIATIQKPNTASDFISDIINLTKYKHDIEITNYTMQVYPDLSPEQEDPKLLPLDLINSQQAAIEKLIKEKISVTEVDTHKIAKMEKDQNGNPEN